MAVALFGPPGKGSFNESGHAGALQAQAAGHAVDVHWIAPLAADERAQALRALCAPGLDLQADMPAGPLDVDRLVMDRRLFAGDHRDRLRDVGAVDRASFTGDAVELLEDRRGPFDGPLVPLDADRILPGGDVHTERLADPPQVLVPRAKDGQDPLGVDHRDRRAGHRSPRRMRRRRSLERRGRTGTL